MGYHKELSYHWMYETQYALPLFAVQQPGSGNTMAISRLQADVTLRDQSSNLHDLMIDETITFGSIGVSTEAALSLDYIYPAARGTSTRPLPDGFPLEHAYSPSITRYARAFYRSTPYPWTSCVKRTLPV